MDERERYTEKMFTASRISILKTNHDRLVDELADNRTSKTKMWPEGLKEAYGKLDEAFMRAIEAEARYLCVLDYPKPAQAGMGTIAEEPKEEISEEELKHLREMAEDAVIQRFTDKIAAAREEASGNDNRKEAENYGG